MKVAIMQPYFLPYVGYFQLINAVDKFVIYDNIEFTKKGWINRNRFLVNGRDEFFTLPLKKDSDYLSVKDRLLADSFESDRAKILRKIKEAYRKAPFADETYPMLEDIFNYQSKNLFDYILNSVRIVCNQLGIQTEMVISSSIDIDHQLRSESKVIEICKTLGASAYINPIGGVELYSSSKFALDGIELSFLQANPFEYSQFENAFVPWLSILDVMMFVSVDEIVDRLINNYTLVSN
ncbi:WbqC family protein [Imperialibacter roseus]|uniref:WbqC family protein n=1 Tax=Imperialibacter roseus TaxID=1324217 RepID=A0ABZ0IP60_9BACT|nr:WbqC family protein [Imperialibacter roseus]WOK06297.1 WbqC family protein [Imperialibacter roseus]